MKCFTCGQEIPSKEEKINDLDDFFGYNVNWAPHLCSLRVELGKPYTVETKDGYLVTYSLRVAIKSEL